MQWVRKKVVGPDKITVISYQHLGIRTVFERPDFEWQKSASETVRHYCTQHIRQNVYKNCHMKGIKALSNKLQDIRSHGGARNIWKKLIILDRHPINSLENQESCKKISQRNKYPTEGHEITETAITNPSHLRKCQPKNFITRS
jgi:hypothetical protein